LIIKSTLETEADKTEPLATSAQAFLSLMQQGDGDFLGRVLLEKEEVDHGSLKDDIMSLLSHPNFTLKFLEPDKMRMHFVHIKGEESLEVKGHFGYQSEGAIYQQREDGSVSLAQLAELNSEQFKPSLYFSSREFERSTEAEKL
jgi:hypothetical protein